MKNILLRSLVNFEKTKDNEILSNYLDNFTHIQASALKFTGAEKTIYEIIESLTSTYQIVPNGEVLRDTLGQKSEAEALELLDDIKTEVPRFEMGFKNLTVMALEQQKRLKIHEIFKVGAEINDTSYKDKKGVLHKGPTDALNYVLQNASTFMESALDRKVESKMSEIEEDSLERYRMSKTNKTNSWGILSGIKPLDLNLKGAKKKELVLVAGSTGELKSTLCMNWAYFGALMQGYNVFYMSLEMSREQIEEMFVTIHSSNPDLWENSEWKDVYPLSWEKVNEGELNDEEEQFYEYCLNDLTNSDENNYGELIIFDPPYDMTPSLLRQHCEILNKKLENGLHLIIPDYPELMESDDKRISNTGEKLNRIMRDLKLLAQQFSDGEGVAVIAPFQINREGKKEAVKKDEKNASEKETGAPLEELRPAYNTFHLSYANQAEKSAGAIVYTYLNDELRETGKVHIGCLKNRWGKIFKPFRAKVYFESRHISYTEEIKPTRDKVVDLTAIDLNNL